MTVEHLKAVLWEQHQVKAEEVDAVMAAVDWKPSPISNGHEEYVAEPVKTSHTGLPTASILTSSATSKLTSIKITISKPEDGDRTICVGSTDGTSTATAPAVVDHTDEVQAAVQTIQNQSEDSNRAPESGSQVTSEVAETITAPTMGPDFSDLGPEPDLVLLEPSDDEAEAASEKTAAPSNPTRMTSSVVDEAASQAATTEVTSSVMSTVIQDTTVTDAQSPIINTRVIELMSRLPPYNEEAEVEAQNGLDMLIGCLRNSAEGSEGRQILESLLGATTEPSKGPSVPENPEVFNEILETPRTETSTLDVNMEPQESMPETPVAEVNPVQQRTLAFEPNVDGPAAVETEPMSSALVPPEDSVAREDPLEEAESREESIGNGTWPWASQEETLSDVTLSDEDAGYPRLVPYDPRYAPSGFSGHLTSRISNVREFVGVMALSGEPSYHSGPYGTRLMSFPAIHRATGAMVMLVSPARDCTTDAVFRDCPEFVRYQPRVPNDIDWSTSFETGHSLPVRGTIFTNETTVYLRDPTL